MLLRAEIFSTIFVQIVALLSLLFIQYNPFLKELTPFLSEELSLKAPPSKLLLREGTNISLDIWSNRKGEKKHTHIYSPKTAFFFNKGDFFEELADIEVLLEEGREDSSLKKLCSLSSEYGLLNIRPLDLSLSNTSLLFEDVNYQQFPLSGSGFAENVTISSLSSSPLIRMKGFSSYLNTSMEAP